MASWGENQAFQLVSFGGGVIWTPKLARQLWFLQIPGCLGVRSHSLIQVEMIIALGTFRGWVLPRPLWTGATEKPGKRESVMPTSQGPPQESFCVCMMMRVPSRCDKRGSFLRVCKVLSHLPSPRVSHNPKNKNA